MSDFVLRDILMKGLSNRASDVHLSVGEAPLFRIDGTLIRVSGYEPLTKEDMEGVMKELLTDAQQERFMKEREYDFSFGLDTGSGAERRFRANFYHERNNLALALRSFPTAVATIKQLGLPESLKEMAQKNSGLFLVTGPTGSGKSTTLAALIQEINFKRSVHIVTLEDPIEYLYVSEAALIHQREIGRDTKSFAEALRRAMRQDPDVILIGEMRDLDTIAAAVTAAETGHLVLATLHTRDSAQSIDRIIDVFPPHQQQQIRIQLSSILLGVISQQLIPLSSTPGRVVATEYLVATNAVRNCIREGKTALIKNAIQTGSTLDMHTMDQDLARLCQSGAIDRGEALAHVADLESFNRYMM